ncbi:MAG: hypothetical protein KAY24_11095 [Candidatus Eisenbacteria sp.]|nr:hypothetical protein [Candidatus Eisenbacteria bacterium]
MSRHILLEALDVEIIQEALTYMSRRFFDPQDSRTILEIEDRLDLARQRLDPGRAAELQLEEQHVPLLKRVLTSYANELNLPSSHSSNRSRIARMKHLARRLGRSGSLLASLRRWLRL